MCFYIFLALLVYMAVEPLKKMPKEKRFILVGYKFLFYSRVKWGKKSLRKKILQKQNVILKITFYIMDFFFVKLNIKEMIKCKLEYCGNYFRFGVGVYLAD